LNAEKPTMKDLLEPMAVLSPGKRELLARMLRERGIDAPRLPAIPRADRSRPLPLSFNQEGLWFIDQLAPHQANYNVPGTVRLRGRLHVAALEQSLSEIVRRHESLRTTFAMTEDGVPFQVVAAARPFGLPMTDLGHLAEAEREAEALRLATEEVRSSFDLTRGPLFRAFLVRLSEEDHVLVLNSHHIVCDGWSMGVFTRELAALYPAFRDGRPSPLSELEVQFADVATWEREWMQGPEARARFAYWKEQLAGPLPELRLPTDRPRPPVPSMRGRHEPLRLSRLLTEEVRALSRREGATPFMTVLAAFDVMLHHYTGQLDLVVGTGVANRGRRELEGLIGHFVTVLPLRADLSGDPSFRELLGRIRRVALGATANPLPLAKLVRDLAPGRDLSRNPLFQVELTLLTPDDNPAVYGYGLSQMTEARPLQDLTLTPLDVEGGVARFDLSIFVWDMPEGLAGTAEYSTDLFEPGTVKRMLDCFESVLDHVVRHPDVGLNAVGQWLTGRERERRTREEAAHTEKIHRRLQNAKRQPVAVDEPS
jgi:hypothetical protein